ncbi:hypothetical protein BOTBODRAFT_34199 [Botryobasidium botryosum FD-172 SS1]|uniref:mRNA m(6)A methyltransferase n=1 Tax=Botryobasidium botryosum (strain FD-172 SS1) TaxID=930990 RepID=A0A067MMD1_BOTB1|nr:hypothetical protein BOTBODRAFT_34199 [Botryobasidium botryosum FD-172 SS1]
MQRVATSSRLRNLFALHHERVHLPVKADHLLRLILAHTDAPSDNASARLRLTDNEVFEAMLRDWATSWEYGTLIVSKDEKEGSLLVEEVHIFPEGDPKGKKRKHDEDDKDMESRKLSMQRRFRPPAFTSLREDLQEVYALLQQGTARGKLLAEEFHSTDGYFEPICPHTTKEECKKHRPAETPGEQPTFCEKVHFRAIKRPHTDPSLGHCSYLNTCYSEPTYAMSPSIGHFSSAPRAPNTAALPSGLGAGGRGKEKAPCRYLHFEVDYDDENKRRDNNRRPQHELRADPRPRVKLGIGLGPEGKNRKPTTDAQWINCDLRRFDCSVLGKFHVIMADPPWDIHMSLPYGTMTDDEMRAMPIPQLQDEGLLFLWVTGRAMEVGRECLRVWGYTRVDEVVWVKTNQLQRVIRTGRTGHWLNHTKEHMLVAIKTVTDEEGNLVWPSWVNRGLDTDVIVSEVRETSRKPEEVYGLIERMCPGGRKVEIFGRKHNARPGWLTLGNQLGQDKIEEPDLRERVYAKYPERRPR